MVTSNMEVVGKHTSPVKVKQYFTVYNHDGTPAIAYRWYDHITDMQI